MALKNINPTTTIAWGKLNEHFHEVKDIHLKELFKNNPNRQNDLQIDFKDFHVDFSKNRITKKTLNLLVDLANEVDLKDAIKQYFSGEKINETEKRAVLHTALRDFSEEEISSSLGIAPYYWFCTKKCSYYDKRLGRNKS